MVKRLRHRPFTAASRVRISYGSPFLYGRLAQLGERLPYKQDVGSSILSSPTILMIDSIQIEIEFLFCPNNSPGKKRCYNKYCGLDFHQDHNIYYSAKQTSFLGLYHSFKNLFNLSFFFCRGLTIAALRLVAIVFFRGDSCIRITFTFKAILARGRFFLFHRGHNLSYILHLYYIYLLDLVNSVTKCIQDILKQSVVYTFC